MAIRVASGAPAASISNLASTAYGAQGSAVEAFFGTRMSRLVWCRFTMGGGTSAAVLVNFRGLWRTELQEQLVNCTGRATVREECCESMAVSNFA